MRFFLLIILSLNLTACYQNKALRNNTLIYCTENIPTLLNPQLSHDIASLDATTHQIYSRLVKIDPNNNQFIPDLAESWQLSDDKLRFRFKLRSGVKFHKTDYFTPTRHLNADDVIYSFNRMLDNQHPYHTVNNQADNYFYNHPFTNFLKAIEKVDNHTLDFVLSKPDVTLLANLAGHYAVIHSKQYATQLLQSGRPESLDTQPIGTGPFKFRSTKKGVIRYDRNEDYWQDNTHFEKLIFVKNSNATKRYTKLVSGECDVISYPAASQLDYISNNKSIILNSEATANIALWAFNTQRNQLKYEDIRRALSFAINKQTIIQAVYYTSAKSTNTLLSNQSWAVKPRINEESYQPLLAKQLLEQAGFDFTLPLTILVPQDADVYNPNFHKTAELIQSNLASIGVKSHIINLTESALKTRLLTGNYDTYLTGMNVHINDPDNVLRPLLSCDSSPIYGNSSRWCSAKTEALLNESISETNFVQRIKNYYLLQDEIHQKRPYLPIAHVVRLDAFSSSISNVGVSPLTGINFQNATRKDLN